MEAPSTRCCALRSHKTHDSHAGPHAHTPTHPHTHTPTAAVQDEYRTLNGGDEVESIYLYKEDRHYTIDRRTRSCHYAAIPTTQKFAPYGVPANASFHAQATIGVTPSTVLVNEFGVHEMFGSLAIT